MCGISGIIALKSNVINIQHIIAMNQAIAHRGPDGHGFLFSNNINHEEVLNRIKELEPSLDCKLDFIEKNKTAFALGHRRLSIIDLSSSAAQPMCDFSGRYWIVFNGEIYNHAELRKELESIGYFFKTDHSDTEVLLNAYAEWGKQCLERLNGMFAFCIYDASRDSFFIARDRLGIKPLYYCFFDNLFYFASEARAILRVSKIPKDIDKTAFYDFLSLNTIPAPKTIFKHVNKIPAAHYMEIKKGFINTPICYWDILSFESNIDSFETNSNKLLELLDNSAQNRMIADVEVGVLLSGGVDSSANLAFLTKHANKQVKAFSIGFENIYEGYQNEFAYSKIVASQVNADYHEIYLTTDEFSEYLNKIIDFQDEPIADTANAMIYCISDYARKKGVKVLLGGEGSDELLIGYKHWQYIFEYYKIFERKLPNSAINLLKNIHEFSVLRDKRAINFYYYNKSANNQTAFWGGSELFRNDLKKNILSNSFLKELDGYSTYEVIEPYYKRFLNSGKDNYYDFMTFLDLSIRLPDLLLARLDRMTMGASIEGRVPFLDHRLVEFCLSIPTEQKIRNNEGKYILKKSLESMLPKEVIWRKKQGFPLPLADILMGDKTGYQQTIVQGDSSLEFLNSEFLYSKSLKLNWRQYWGLFNFFKWYLSL